MTLPVGTERVGVGGEVASLLPRAEKEGERVEGKSRNLAALP